MGDLPTISGPPPGVGLLFDLTMWPLVVMRMPPVTLDGDIEYMRRCYERVFAAPNRHALVVDTTEIVKAPDAILRRQIKEFEDSHREIIREKNLGSAIVIRNTLVRGAFSALRWISPQPAPNRAFATLESAARWCIEALETDGQPVPIAAYVMAGLANEAAS